MTNFSAGSVVRRVEQNNSYSFLKVFFCNPKDPQTMINYGSLLKIYTSDIRLYIKYNPAGFPTIFWTSCWPPFPPFPIQVILTGKSCSGRSKRTHSLPFSSLHENPELLGTSDRKLAHSKPLENAKNKEFTCFSRNRMYYS